MATAVVKSTALWREVKILRVNLWTVPHDKKIGPCREVVIIGGHKWRFDCIILFTNKNKNKRVFFCLQTITK